MRNSHLSATLVSLVAVANAANDPAVAAGSSVGLIGTSADPEVWTSTAGTPAPGWNTELDFDDSGWGPPVELETWGGISSEYASAVWDESPVACSPAVQFTWLRATFAVETLPATATLFAHADDDCDVYLNGVLVISDHNCSAGQPSGIVDVTQLLVPGENLLAIAADDCFGGCHGVITWIEAEIPPCPFDLDGNGTVFVEDLLLLLEEFRSCDESPADFDGDGCVSAADLAMLVRNFGPCPEGGCPYDVNGDGAVDEADLQQVIDATGPCAGCPEDVDGNGFVNGQDVAAVASHFGPCPGGQPKGEGAGQGPDPGGAGTPAAQVLVDRFTDGDVLFNDGVGPHWNPADQSIPELPHHEVDGEVTLYSGSGAWSIGGIRTPEVFSPGNMATVRMRRLDLIVDEGGASDRGSGVAVKALGGLLVAVDNPANAHPNPYQNALGNVGASVLLEIGAGTDPDGPYAFTLRVTDGGAELVPWAGILDGWDGSSPIDLSIRLHADGALDARVHGPGVRVVDTVGTSQHGTYAGNIDSDGIVDTVPDGLIAALHGQGILFNVASATYEFIRVVPSN
ncbi:MAG: dockerin type I domain-containing protein [Planctomycetota bacterium]|jgi:hypothetical protein